MNTEQRSDHNEENGRASWAWPTFICALLIFQILLCLISLYFALAPDNGFSAITP